MRERWLPSVVLASVLLCSACQGSTAESAGPASAGAKTSQEGENAGAGDAPALDRPTAGTCRMVPEENAFDSDYWFDDSPIVACSDAHTTETIASIEVDSPTIEAVTTPDATDTYTAWCASLARRYVAADRTHWAPYVWLVYLPSEQQIDEGASWLRCDVAFAADIPYATPARHQIPAHNAVIDHGDDLWPCVDSDPRPGDTQPLIPCDRPHRYESTGRKALVHGLDGEPSPALLRRESAQCRNDLTSAEASRGLDIVTAWEEPSDDATLLYGTCWLYRIDGTRLPARG